MNSLAEENYLKALFSLSNEKGDVNINELSKRLDIKMPTVTSMMKKLATKGLVHYEKYKPVTLTAEGKRKAALIIRKHRLTEMFLVEVMGFGWEEVHDIAEQVEHVDSPAFFRKMDDLLGHPPFDPHGSPIPDKNGRVKQKQFHKLSECREQEKVKVVAVANSSDDFLKFLNKRDIRLGIEMEIETVEAFDRTMMVSYNNHRTEPLSQSACERLLVEKI